MGRFSKKTIVLLGLILAFSCAQARAAQVDVFVPMEEGVSTANLRRQAMDEGFAKAVTLQAQALLSGPLSPERLQALDERLAPQAAKYVQGYKELGMNQGPDGLDMVLDVSVNQAALKKELMRLGVYYTAKQSLPFTMNVNGGGPDDYSLLVKLQDLTGVSARSGAVPVLTLSQNPDGSWKGELATAQGDRIMASSPSLDALWVGLWERFFSKGSTAERFMPTETLVVQGWYVPEGVRGFDMVLAEYGDVIESSTLVGMTMRPLGIEAVWKLQVTDLDALRARLDEYVASRSLTYRFEQSQPQADAASGGG